MNTLAKSYMIDQLIQEKGDDFNYLLLNEIFMRYVRVADVRAIKFIEKNIIKLISILTQDFTQIQADNLSQILTSFWEIIELNIEEILILIEVQWELIFEVNKLTYVPEIQFGYIYRILQIVQDRKPLLLSIALNSHENLLKSYEPFLSINSASLIILAFFERSYHPQQLQFLKNVIQGFENLDELSAINITFIIHEIISKLQYQPLMNYLLSQEVIQILLSLIQNERLSDIILKNGAHCLSLISNYYSQDMQNIYLDEPTSQQISEQFKTTDFYKSFNAIVIQKVMLRIINKSCRLGLLSIKLVEIVDNLVRISDLELWQSMENIMQCILLMLNKFQQSDILITYVQNLVTFIFDRAISDFHPYWTVDLIVNQQIQNNKRFNNIILQFEQQLSIKLIRDNDFLPYYNELLKIQNTLKNSNQWQKLKDSSIQYQLKHKNKLGEDSDTPSADSQIIIRASSQDSSDEIIEFNDNIFINCQQRGIEINIKNIQENNNEENNLPNTQTTLNKLKNLFLKMDEQDEICQSTTPQKTINSVGKQKQMWSSLNNNDINHNETQEEILKKLSLSSSTNLKKLSKSFQEFTIDVINNKKVLKKDEKILKVDEIDK